MPTPESGNPLWETNFPWYPQLMAQVTRYFKTWSIYVGGENLTNFKQGNPIIDAANPWGPNSTDQWHGDLFMVLKYMWDSVGL